MIVSLHDAADNGSEEPKQQVLPNGMPAAWTADDPDLKAVLPEAVLEASRRYVAAGLSVIPIEAEYGSKSPDVRRLPRSRHNDGNRKPSWKVYQVRLPREDELLAWYNAGGSYGLAVLGGIVSGGGKGLGLEIIDLDNFDLVGPWLEAVEARLPGLITKLSMVRSPRPGLHVYYRSSKCGGCQKLACAPMLDENGQEKKKTLIELKGEGGYCLVPPSPHRCHPSNQLYLPYAGTPDLAQAPVITPAEREALLDVARLFNRCAEAEPVRAVSVHAPKQIDGNRPGDDFERRASWTDILTPYGWKLVGRRGEIEDWRRPGKSDGISATVNYADNGKLHVFSSNADPFEEGRSYSKFAAYARLKHGGNFQNAAQQLQQEDFGRQGLPAGKRMSAAKVTTSVLRLDK